MNRPLAIDLFAGIGGWTDGLLAEGYNVVGFDIERHDYGDGKCYPAQLVLQDVLTLHGRQFKDASIIVASPPCQEYSYMAMPWSRAKTIAAEYRSGKRDVKKLTALFDACFRIQLEAIEAAGHHIPMVVENVLGAQPWVGRARWNFGSYYLWGDVPALMPITMPRRKGPIAGTGNQLCCVRLNQIESDGLKLPGNNSEDRWSDRPVQRLKDALKQAEGIKAGDRSVGGKWNSSFADSLKISEGSKTVGHLNIRDGHTHTRHLTNQAEHGTKFSQSGDAWFAGEPRDKMLGEKGPAAFGSKSNARKAASAAIAKIPFALARWIAKVYYPVDATPISR